MKTKLTAKPKPEVNWTVKQTLILEAKLRTKEPQQK